MYVVGDDGIVVDAVAFFQDIGILAAADNTAKILGVIYTPY